MKNQFFLLNKTGLLLIVLLLMIQNAVSQVYLNYNQRCNQLTMDCTLQSHAEWSVGIGGDGILIEVTDKLGQKNVLYNSIGCSQYFIVTKEDSVIIDIFCFPNIMYPSDCACEDQPKPIMNSADLQTKIILTPDTIFGKMVFSLHDFSKPNWLNKESFINNVEKSIPYYYGMIPSLLKEFDNKEDRLLEFITKYDKMINEKQISTKYPEYEYYRDFYRMIIPYMKTSLLSFKDFVHLGKSMKKIYEDNIKKNQINPIDNY